MQSLYLEVIFVHPIVVHFISHPYSRWETAAEVSNYVV